MRIIPLVALLAACGEPTVYPEEPLPAYGGTEGTWNQCSTNTGEQGVLGISNTLDSEVEVSVLVAGNSCEEVPLATVEPGATEELDLALGTVVVLRDPDTLYIYNALQWLGEPDTLVVP